jgi:hypothetical protein
MYTRGSIALQGVSLCQGRNGCLTNGRLCLNAATTVVSADPSALNNTRFCIDAGDLEQLTRGTAAAKKGYG